MENVNLATLAPYFADEDKATEFVEKLMWPKGPICPHCNHKDRFYRLEGKSHRRGLWKCGTCRKQFSVKVGTIFEGSHIPLTKWLLAIYMMCSSKKGVSANQLHRALGISYKSAWHLCHRIRYAMTQEPLVGKLRGIVEVDETYVGGKRGNNHHLAYRSKPTPEKAVVMTLIERTGQGQVRTFPVPNAKKGTLQAIMRPNIDGKAVIMTDSFVSYGGINRHFAGHGVVDHSKEYVRGVIHTNFAESYHSLLKRGILGTYHHVSTEHLPRYLREFEFRWNNRSETDGERTIKAIRGAKGKRLIYRTPSKP